MSQHQLTIALGQFSSSGSKPENQDFHGALQPEGDDLSSKGITCAIADGISTSRRGAEAAEIAVKSFLTDYYCTSEGWSALNSGKRVIAATNSWMYAQNARTRPREEGESRESAGLICTLSALVLKSRVAHVFHVGDGRILRLSETGEEELTTPHRISLGGGRTYLGRALGANQNVEVEYCQVALQIGDIFLLTTDGVHEFVSTADLRDQLASSADLDDAARGLAELALERGSDDNLTVQIVRVETLPAGEVEDLLGREMQLPSAPAMREGSVFEGYEILKQLHAGSRSHVYLARDVEDDAKVALKVLSTEQAQDKNALGALLLEEWVMRRLTHPNLLAAAPTRGPRSHAFSVSQFVEGISLHKWMIDNGQADLPSTRKIVKQISTGLEAMHRREMLHRDLRPQNVLVGGDGHVTITDFGSTQVAGLDEVVARAYEDAAFAGTMQYSAPELYLGHSASTQSDVFSLGVIAYQMLTGELPYGPRVAAANTPAAQKRLRYVPATRHNPDLPDWVDAALAHAVAVDPAKRYAEPAEFIGDLANPNHDLLRQMNRPLLERGSARSWRIIAALLAAALVFSIFTRPQVPSGNPATNQEYVP